MIKSRLIASLFVAAFAFVGYAQSAVSDDGGSSTEAKLSAPGVESGYYVFCYFKGDGLDGVHFATSRDGYKWTPLNGDKATLPAPVGKEQKKTRDPSITRGPDGIFRMVWTVAWDGQSFGYAHSKDLINWEDAVAVPAMQHEPTTRNVWAPEVYYDDATEQFYIIWSSTIPGRFSPAEKGTSETRYDHRVYYTTTKDFKTFAPTKLYFDPGHNVIDAFLTKKDDVYYLFYKDETLFPAEKKIILVATSKSAEGPFSEGKQISAQNWVEGPSSLFVGDDWIVYYDCYRDNQYGAVRYRNGEWENVANLISFPKDTRHGTAFEVEKEIFDKLLEKYGY